MPLNWIRTSLILLPLLGCTPASPVAQSLVVSPGHGDCLQRELFTDLELARIAEVIPATRACRPGDLVSNPFSLVNDCPKHITTVHFRRLYRPQLTDSIQEQGWLLQGTPVRVALTVENSYTVFVPLASREFVLNGSQCTAFANAIRGKLASHIAYGHEKKWSKKRNEGK